MESRAGVVKEPVICHICDFQPEYGGSFIEALVHLNRYCRRHLNIGIFCIFPVNARSRNWLKILDEEGMRYGFIPRQRSIVRHVRLLLQNYNLLILHTHFFLFDLSAIFMKLIFFRNSKIVWHYHNPTELTLKQRIKDRFKIRLCFNHFGDRCIAVGDGVYKSILDAGIAREKAVLIHNGVSITRFLNNSKLALNVQDKLPTSREHTVFLLLGWDPVRKGVDIFLKAADELCRRKYKNCRFLIVGRAETRRFVSQILCKSELSQDSFRIIDPVEDFSLLLKGVDVFVSASRSEGLTYSVLEAMTAEKIILSSDIPSVQETYGKSKGVWLFPSEDWKMLTELMEKVLLLKSDEIQSLGRANSHYVVENHSLDSWSEEVGQLYKELIGRSKQSLNEVSAYFA